MKLSHLAALTFFAAPFCGAGQTSDTLSHLKINEWEQHLPWRRARYVTSSADKVYFATELAVVEIDKADRSPKFLTKVEGLSDIGMGVIRYSRAANVLLLSYTNSNLDLWRPDGSLTNMPFIKANIALTGDKKIYDIFFEDKSAYLACGFGIVKLNLEREEVEYTTFTNRAVRSFAIFQDHLYAGTDDGLYRLSTSYDNPADFNQWELLGPAQGFPADYSVGPMASFNGSLYFGSGKTLYRFDGQNLLAEASDNSYNVLCLTTEGAGLVVGWKEQFNGRWSYVSAATGVLSDLNLPCDATHPIYAVEDAPGQFWLCDDVDDFRFFDKNTNQCERFNYNSPSRLQVSELEISNDVLYAATPGPPSDLHPEYFREGIYKYDAGAWSQFSVTSNPELQQGDCYADIWRVAAHPDGGKFYGGSFIGGLIENDHGTVKCFTQDNSILQNAGASGTSRTAIGGMAFDQDKNLWISNYDADSPIAVLKNDGTWRNFSGTTSNNLLQVAIDQNGYKWFVVAFNGGVLVYDSGADLDSPGDDRYRLITNSNSNLPSNSVNCLAVDLDGDVWVGTQQGVISFECGSNVFDETNCKGSRRILKVDDFNGYLLETENVTSIAVDGGNRKWFGTTNGIFVLSADVTEQVGRYSTSNSPLFDNTVVDMAINQRNGEVWVATEKGLQTIRTAAIAGGKVNRPQPYAYPNPVRPEYDGPIAIYGLARDANVKITDVAGNLVFEGKALGGQAVWNGRDYLGRRAASGVYVILATSAGAFDAPDAVMAKVVILN